jgi:hypothetical protein
LRKEGEARTNSSEFSLYDDLISAPDESNKRERTPPDTSYDDSSEVHTPEHEDFGTTPLHHLHL